MSTKVLRSLEDPTATHCVDIFVRSDGTFGFEEYRRDHEDQRGWFPLQHYSTLIFETEDDAFAQAKARVVWLVADDGEGQTCN